MIRQVLFGLALGAAYLAGIVRMGALSAAPRNDGQQVECFANGSGEQIGRAFLAAHSDRRIVTIYPELGANFKGEAMPGGYCIVHEPIQR